MRGSDGAAPGASAGAAHTLIVDDLTVVTSRSLHLRLRRAVEQGARHVRVDLRGVADVDAAGVAVLLVFSRLLPPLGGRLEIVGAGADVQEILDGVHVRRMLSV